MTAAAAYRGDAADDSMHDEIVNAPTLAVSASNLFARVKAQMDTFWADTVLPVLCCRSCREEDELWTTGFSHSARVGAAQSDIQVGQAAHRTGGVFTGETAGASRRLALIDEQSQDDVHEDHFDV